MRNCSKMGCAMLPDAIFTRLDRHQLAEYLDALTAETARARARLAQADDDQARLDAYRHQATAARQARRQAKPDHQATALRMLRAGCSNSEIAARLVRSTRTVERLLKR
jgi:DNA-binding NarL/FixJ family response regulator